MFRFSVGFITSTAALSMLALSTGDAAAEPARRLDQPPQRRGLHQRPGPHRRRGLHRRPDRHRWHVQRLPFRVQRLPPWLAPRRWPAPLQPSPGRPRRAWPHGSPLPRGHRLGSRHPPARRLRSSAPRLRRAPRAGSSDGSRLSSSASKPCERDQRLPQAPASPFRRSSRPSRIPACSNCNRRAG